MAIYYQHVGEVGSTRDFPRSLGTITDGLKRFSFADIEPYIQHLTPEELLDIRGRTKEFAPTGFQVWGLPSGAGPTLKRMVTGDYLMLLESIHFSYVGQVIHRVSEPCWDLSNHIWYERRFPIIVLLQGELIFYPWANFIHHFSFNPKYHLLGQTMKLAEERIVASSSGSEENFIATLATTKGTNPVDQEKDFTAFANNLVEHLRSVKVRAEQDKFRKEILLTQGERCAVCDLEIRPAIEAAHVIPKEDGGSDDARNGIVLCASHHRMFDAKLFAINPSSLAVIPLKGYSTEALHIVRPDITQLTHRPHQEALEWRWQHSTPEGHT